MLRYTSNSEIHNVKQKGDRYYITIYRIDLRNAKVIETSYILDEHDYTQVFKNAIDLDSDAAQGFILGIFGESL